MIMNPEVFKEAIVNVSNPLPGSIPESFTYTITVKKKYERLTVVDFFLNAVPRSKAQIWIEKINSGNLKIDDKKVTINYKVKAGEVATHQTDPRIEPNINPNIQLIYNDNEVLVVNKPSPLPVHASGRFVRNTLLNILNLAFHEVDFKLTHRIDANTTGIVVIAKNKAVANNIREQFENKTVKKQYIALVEGIVENDISNLSQSIGKEVLVGGARKIDEDGKTSHTEIEVLERRIDKDQTLLKVTPFTGRTNQIRLHLAELGHPIVGDIGHKDQTYFINNPFTYATDSLFLHAHQITFIHPVTNKEIVFKAEIPKKFNYQ